MVNLRTFARGTHFRFIICQVGQRLTNRTGLFASAAENFLARASHSHLCLTPLEQHGIYPIDSAPIAVGSNQLLVHSSAACAQIIVWSYWNTIEGLMGEWVRPQYSHGWLVPVFTAVLLAMRHEPFQKVANSVRWWGLAIMSAGIAQCGSWVRAFRFTRLTTSPSFRC